MDNEKIKSIHSRYNPRGEAERYIDSLELKKGVRFFILIEPGFGYIIDPLRKKAPDAKIIVLHAGEIGCAARETPDSEWKPGTGISVEEFLEREIPDSEAAEIRILEWRPALSVYGRAYLSLVEETAEFIKRSDANTRTLKVFGRSWFRNFLNNVTIFRKFICPFRLSIPLVITGAGPGLEEVMPLLRKETSRGGLFVLAVSSSAPALEAGGIAPNMVISTDGGGWAKFHLYEGFRQGKEPEGSERTCPLAAAMIAAIPSQYAARPIMPISDGSLWQTLILNKSGIPHITLPQRGTVTASALDLAFALTDNRIYIAGIDLANRDIRSHARPYSFDRFLEEKEARLNPVYSQTFKRSSMIKEGGSFNIYASWFGKQLSAYPKRLFSLGSNNPLFSSIETSRIESGPSIDMPEFRTISAEGVYKKKALEILEPALRNPGQAEQLCKELGALLFPGSKKVSADEIIDAIRGTAGQWERGPLYHG